MSDNNSNNDTQILPATIYDKSYSQFFHKNVEQLQPKAVISYYANESGGNAYLELTEISNGKGLAPVPLSENSLRSMLKAVTPEDKEKVVMDDLIMNHWLIYVSQGVTKTIVAWITQKGIRKVKVQNNYVLVPLPAMLFIGSVEKVNCFFIKDRKFNSKTELYKPLIPNIYADGSICFGQNKIGTATNISRFINHVMYVFYNAGFTEHGAIKSKDKIDLTEHLLSMHGKEQWELFEPFEKTTTIKDEIRKYTLHT